MCPTSLRWHGRTADSGESECSGGHCAWSVQLQWCVCVRSAAVGQAETRGRRRIVSLVARIACFGAAAAPCVSMSSPSNVGATGGGTITIGGLDFGGLVVTPSASLGVAEMCGSAAWTSSTTVACGPAAYGGSDVHTAVCVSAVAGTLMMFSFDGSPLAARFSPTAADCCRRSAGCEHGFGERCAKRRRHSHR
jgi:hypothetical protein